MEKLILFILALALVMVPMSAMANNHYFKVPSTWATGTSSCNYQGIKSMTYSCNTSAPSNSAAVADRYWKFRHRSEEKTINPSYNNMAAPY